MPLVSVIIPTYNRAEFLKRAIGSVLEQTYKDFEIIIVDDGSSDGTERVIKELNDVRMQCIRHPHNKGASAARNSGIRFAQGQYIAFNDDDDMWLPEMLEKQIKTFKASAADVGVVYSKLVRIIDETEIYFPPQGLEQKEGWLHDIFIRKNFIGLPASICRRECFEKVGMFDEELRCLDDWELWIRISKYFKFKYIDEILVKSYHSPKSISTDKLGNIKAVKLIAKKHFNDIKKDRKLLEIYYTYIGLFLLRGNQAIEAMPFFLKAFLAAPLEFLRRVIKHFNQKN